MARGFAIHNAPTDHGGIIPATQIRSSQMGNLFVVAGDGHFCPKCKCWSKVLKSHDHVLFDGKAVAYAGDLLSCGARILPQQNHVVGDSGTSYGSPTEQSSATTNFVNMESPKSFGLQHQLFDEITGEALINFPYQLKLKSGEIIEGLTDQEGKTTLVDTGNNEEEIELIIHDFSKPMPEWE